MQLIIALLLCYCCCCWQVVLQSVSLSRSYRQHCHRGNNTVNVVQTNAVVFNILCCSQFVYYHCQNETVSKLCLHSSSLQEFECTQFLSLFFTRLCCWKVFLQNLLEQLSYLAGHLYLCHCSEMMRFLSSEMHFSDIVLSFQSFQR